MATPVLRCVSRPRPELAGRSGQASIVAQKWPHITLPKGQVELDVSRAHSRRSEPPGLQAGGDHNECPG
jgi:hypothetical protein